MEQEYHPSYDEDIFENEPEPVAHEHDQQKKDWQEADTQTSHSWWC